MANKVIKRGIKKAILIYEDPETGEPRRVTFGDPEGVFQLFMDNAQILFDRLQKIQTRKHKNEHELRDSIEESTPEFATIHGKGAYKDARMTLTYEVKELN